MACCIFAPAAANSLIIACRLSLALARESTQMGSSLRSVSTVHPLKYVVRGMEALIASLISHTVSGLRGSLLQIQRGHMNKPVLR